MGIPLPGRVIATDSISYLTAHLMRSDCLSYQPRRVLRHPGLLALTVTDEAYRPNVFRVVVAYEKDKRLTQASLGLLRCLSSESGDRVAGS